MKLRKEKLKEMILQEYNNLVSSGEATTRALGDFETFTFENHIKAILANMEQMDGIIRKDGNLNRKTLILMKEKMLEDLYVAIGHLEGAIDARLKNQNEDL